MQSAAAISIAGKTRNEQISDLHSNTVILCFTSPLQVLSNDNILYIVMDNIEPLEMRSNQ